MADIPKRFPTWDGMTIQNSSEFNPDAIDETAAAAAEAKRVADETRDFVMARYKKLIGCEIPVEILRIQVLPSHNCLIVDDWLLLSFVEAKQLLEQIDDD